MEVEIGDLFDTLVVPAESDVSEPREVHRSSKYIKGKMNTAFRKLGLLAKLATADSAKEMRIVECASGVKHTFDYAYQNHVVHRIDALSFDHGNPSERVARARSFANLVEDFRKGPGNVGEPIVEAVIQVPTEGLFADIYIEAKKILDTVPSLQRTEVASDLDLEAFCRRTLDQMQL